MNFLERLKIRFNRKNIYPVSDYWDRKAETYHEKWVSMWENHQLNQLYSNEMEEAIEDCIKNFATRYVVDIGCGTGRVSRYFYAQGCRIAGFDFSAKTIALAKKQSPKEIEYKHLSVFDFKEQEKYNLAFTYGVLTVACREKHDVTSALHNIYRSLKPDGEILLIEPLHTSFIHFVLQINFKTFISLVEESGFEIIKTRQLSFWPTRILLAYFNIPMFITKPVYKVGQLLMRWVPNSGDCKLVYARKKSNP